MRSCVDAGAVDAKSGVGQVRGGVRSRFRNGAGRAGLGRAAWGGWRSCWAFVLCAAALSSGPVRGADSAAIDEESGAEAMVRARYYEGLPEERARDCSQACAARLIEMLDDQGERRHHANILRVLGFSPHPRAYEALASFAAHEPEGDVPGAVYNARVETMLALGRHAKRDPRALQLLLERLDQAPPAPGWSAGPMRGEALRGAMRRGVMRGLALSGRPEAGARLRAMEAAARARATGWPVGLQAKREHTSRRVVEQHESLLLTGVRRVVIEAVRLPPLRDHLDAVIAPRLEDDSHPPVRRRHGTTGRSRLVRLDPHVDVRWLPAVLHA